MTRSQSCVYINWFNNMNDMQIKHDLIQQIHRIIASAQERAIRSVDTERVLMSTPEDIANKHTCMRLGKKARLYIKYIKPEKSEYKSEYVIEFEK